MYHYYYACSKKRKHQHHHYYYYSKKKLNGWHNTVGISCLLLLLLCIISVLCIHKFDTKAIHVLCYERNVYSNPLINLIYTDHTCIVTIAQHMQLLKCVHTKIACSQITTGHSQHNWTLSINMETTSLLVSECSNG